MLTSRIDRAARDVASRVRERFGARVGAVRVFGSQARGEASSGSDLDVFVAVAGVTHRERATIFGLAAEVSMEHLVTVQVFAPGDDELAWLARAEARILRDIEQEGIAL